MKQLILKNYFLVEDSTKAKQNKYRDLKEQWLGGKIKEDEIREQVKVDNLTFKGRLTDEAFDEIIAFYKREDTENMQNWLSRQMLHGTQSRARTRFKKMLLERGTEIEEEYIRIKEDNTKKNKKGEMLYWAYKKDKDGEIIKNKEGNPETEKVTQKQGSLDNYIEDTAKFNREVELYLNEDFKIDVTPERQDAIYGVKDVILDTKEEFTGKMAERYEAWCDCLENLKEIKKK